MDTSTTTAALQSYPPLQYTYVPASTRYAPYDSGANSVSVPPHDANASNSGNHIIANVYDNSSSNSNSNATNQFPSSAGGQQHHPHQQQQQQYTQLTATTTTAIDPVSSTSPVPSPPSPASNITMSMSGLSTSAAASATTTTTPAQLLSANYKTSSLSLLNGGGEAPIRRYSTSSHAHMYGRGSNGGTASPSMSHSPVHGYESVQSVTSRSSGHSVIGSGANGGSSNASGVSGSELAHALRPHMPSGMWTVRSRSSTVSNSGPPTVAAGYPASAGHVHSSGNGSSSSSSASSAATSGAAAFAYTTPDSGAASGTASPGPNAYSHSWTGAQSNNSFGTASALNAAYDNKSSTYSGSSDIGGSLYGVRNSSAQSSFTSGLEMGYGSRRVDTHVHSQNAQSYAQAHGHPQLRLSVPHDSAHTLQEQGNPLSAGSAIAMSPTQSTYFISPSPTSLTHSPLTGSGAAGHTATVSPHVLSLPSVTVGGSANAEGASTMLAKREFDDGTANFNMNIPTHSQVQCANTVAAAYTFVDDSADFKLPPSSNSASAGAARQRGSSSSASFHTGANNASGQSHGNSSGAGNGAGLLNATDCSGGQGLSLTGEEEALAPRVRATYASAHMRKCMGLFRLNPFASMSSSTPLGSGSFISGTAMTLLDDSLNDVLIFGEGRGSGNGSKGKARRRRARRGGGSGGESEDDILFGSGAGLGNPEEQTLTYEGVPARAHTRQPRLFVHHMDAGGVLRDGEPPEEENGVDPISNGPGLNLGFSSRSGAGPAGRPTPTSAASSAPRRSSLRPSTGGPVVASNSVKLETDVHTAFPSTLPLSSPQRRWLSASSATHHSAPAGATVLSPVHSPNPNVFSQPQQQSSYPAHLDGHNRSDAVKYDYEHDYDQDYTYPYSPTVPVHGTAATLTATVPDDYTFAQYSDGGGSSPSSSGSGVGRDHIDRSRGATGIHVPYSPTPPAHIIPPILNMSASAYGNSDGNGSVGVSASAGGNSIWARASAGSGAGAGGRGAGTNNMTMNTGGDGSAWLRARG